jgi:hypothetical protein
MKEFLYCSSYSELHTGKYFLDISAHASTSQSTFQIKSTKQSLSIGSTVSLEKLCGAHVFKTLSVCY